MLTLPNIGLVNRIPLWLTVLVISRDVGIVLTVAIVNLAIGPRTFKPSPLGKAATAIFIVTCVVVMYFNYLGLTSREVDAAIWVVARDHARVGHRLRLAHREESSTSRRGLRVIRLALYEGLRETRP